MVRNLGDLQDEAQCLIEGIIDGNTCATCAIRLATPQQPGNPDVGIENDAFGHCYASWSNASTWRSRSSSGSVSQFTLRAAHARRALLAVVY